jgi:hypothetical protein
VQRCCCGSDVGEGVEVFVEEHVAVAVCQADLHGPRIGERGGLYIEYDQARISEDAAGPPSDAFVVCRPGGGPAHRADGVVQADVLFPERLHVPVSAGVELGVDGVQVVGAFVDRPGGPVGVAGPYEVDGSGVDVAREEMAQLAWEVRRRHGRGPLR